MSYKVNPRIDFAFKKLFGNEHNKDLLISLINSIVPEKDQVEDIEILNPYNPANFKEDKISILDIKAKGSNNRYFNIEVQITDEHDYDKRALFYWAKLYSGQIKEGESYSKLNKTIAIHFLNFLSIPDKKHYHGHYILQDNFENGHHFKDISLHTIELSKFEGNKDNITLQELTKKVKNKLDIWVAFLTKFDLLNKDNLPTKLNTPEVKKALTEIETMSLNDDERELYEAHQKWHRFEESALLKAEKIGLGKGMAEGAKKEKLAIARKLKATGLSLENIADATGLSREEIENLPPIIDQK